MASELALGISIGASVGAAIGAFGDLKTTLQGVKTLSNHDCGYRLRAGRYRVLFDFDGAIRLVQIEEVRKRDEHTY